MDPCELSCFFTFKIRNKGDLESYMRQRRKQANNCPILQAISSWGGEELIDGQLTSKGTTRDDGP